jgi:hypothetical protein
MRRPPECTVRADDEVGQGTGRKELLNNLLGSVCNESEVFFAGYVVNAFVDGLCDQGPACLHTSPARCKNRSFPIFFSTLDLCTDGIPLSIV